MTHAEVLVWNGLEKKQMLGRDFDRQRPIDAFIVDFYCKDLMLTLQLLQDLLLQRVLIYLVYLFI